MVVNGLFSGSVNASMNGQIFIYNNIDHNFVKFDIQCPTSVPPTMVSSPLNVLATELDNVLLTCTFIGVPKPVITWQREEGYSLPPATRTLVHSAVSRNSSNEVYNVI